MRAEPPIELIEHAAKALDDLCQEVVFLGGAVVSLLLTEKGGLPPRVTKDVDVAIEATGSYINTIEFDRRLHALGFRNDMDGPVCRYLHDQVVIDVISVNPESPDGVNSWYPLAITTAQHELLPSGTRINLIEPVCFLGTKLAAFRSPSREYHDDMFLSRDFEDIVRIIDGRPNIGTEVLRAQEDLRTYVQHEFARIVKTQYIEEAIAEHIDPGRNSIVIGRIRSFLN